MTESKTKALRGFAVMTQAQRANIASMGGKAAHARGTAHQFDSSEAREAGRKGGLARRDKLAQLKAMQTAAAVEVSGGNV